MTKRRPTGYNNANYIDHRNCTVQIQSDTICESLSSVSPLPPPSSVVAVNPEWFDILVPDYPGCRGTLAIQRTCNAVVVVRWSSCVVVGDDGE